MFLHLSVSHSVHRGGVCPNACWDTHPQQTPPLGRHPWQTPPWADTPWVNTPLGRHPQANTPQADTPWQTPTPWAYTPPQEDTRLGRHPPPPTATAADGTHPTGMQPCLVIDLSRNLFRCGSFLN